MVELRHAGLHRELHHRGDPIARFGPGGGLYISHIQFNKGTNLGKVAVTRYLDFNNFEGVPSPGSNVEDESPASASPVGYLGTTDVATGTAGKFLDKPSIGVAPGSGPACTVNGQIIPATNVYVAWTEFLSNSDQVLRTEGVFRAVHRLWRDIRDARHEVERRLPSQPGDRYCGSPDEPEHRLRCLAAGGGRPYYGRHPLRQVRRWRKDLHQGAARRIQRQLPTLRSIHDVTTFRTLGYPAMVLDETGRVYLAVSARVGAPVKGIPPADPRTGTETDFLEGRIIVTSTTDGVLWDPPEVIVDGEQPRGHQFMPAIAYAGGRLNLTWYDLRYDVSNVFRGFADEKDVLTSRSSNPEPFRHTLDVRGAQATISIPAPPGYSSWPPLFSVYGISEVAGDELKQKISLYLTQKKIQPEKQLNFNRPNLKLYSGGTKPFMGDYIGTAGVQYATRHRGWVDFQHGGHCRFEHGSSRVPDSVD